MGVIFLHRLSGFVPFGSREACGSHRMPHLKSDSWQRITALCNSELAVQNFTVSLCTDVVKYKSEICYNLIDHDNISVIPGDL